MKGNFPRELSGVDHESEISPFWFMGDLTCCIIESVARNLKRVKNILFEFCNL